MKPKLHLCLAITCLVMFTGTQAQLFKIALDEKAKNASLIVEGKVIAQKSFWNDDHSMIYTANTVEVYKIFKGQSSVSTIEVITQGGVVGTQFVDVSELVKLDNGQVGVFFCFENSLNIKSPTSRRVLYDVYSSDQGFLRYDLQENKASAPFAAYNGIETSLYQAIEKQTGQARRIVNPSFSVSSILRKNATASDNGQAGTQAATITGFAPASVHGGTLNDPLNCTLTITGNGFGNTPAGKAGINFKNGNSGSSDPDFRVAYNSPYMVSWSNTQIVVRVPGNAATGRFAVVLNDSTVTKSTTNLKVEYSVLNLAFDFSAEDQGTVVIEPRLIDANGKGGYTYKFSSSTEGGGKDLSADSAAVKGFTRAVNTWREVVGANLIQGPSTTVQKINASDAVNLVAYDNSNTGQLPMAAGVLEVTYSSGQVCYATLPEFHIFTAQKTGFDILLRNPPRSQGAIIPFEKGPCFPAFGTYDLENIMLHEIGHALNLAHVNADLERKDGDGSAEFNPSKVMHYSIVDYADRRSLDDAAYQGGLYTVTPQPGQDFGNCDSTHAMQPLDFTPLANDNCPGVFPVTATPPGTVVNFDLVHATSNTFTDPAFTQVNCAGTGAFVTNNAWYALKTTAKTNGTLSVKISGYATTPAELANCTGQGVRMAVYALNACPVGQSFPQPIACATFTGNTSLANINGLAANTTYVLYFDGLRNTKASFKVTLDGSALPIILADFTGEYVKGMNNLYMNITQAVNVKSINIEKSADGNNFNFLDVLPVPSNQLLGKHTYVDAQPFAVNNYYRLKVVDNDGNFQYSKTILLRNTASRLIYVYPNPAKNNVNVSFSGTPAGRYNFTVYDVAGKAMYKTIYTLNSTNQTVSLPLTFAAAGVYMVKITNAAGETVSQQKIVKE